MGTSRVFLTSMTFCPLHFLHLSFSDTVLPSPRHSPQWLLTCWYMPGPNITIFSMTPFPLQREQTLTAEPPLPSQTSQLRVQLCAILMQSPLYAFSREIRSSFLTALFFLTLEPWERDPPPPPNMENMSKRSDEQGINQN